MKYDIFISYRRRGGYETAKHLYDLMTRDGYSVSFDIDTLRSGDFNVELLKRIDECTDFLLILNQGALDRCFDSSVRREEDWLRNELAYALQKGKNVIPIMLDGFTAFPDDLPSDIIRVTRRNGPKYDQYYFDDFYRRLKEMFLDTPAPEQSVGGSEKMATIRIKSDMACRVMKLGEELCTAEAGVYTTIRLKRGRYLLDFVSIENSVDHREMDYTVEDNDMEDLLLVELASVRSARLAAESAVVARSWYQKGDDSYASRNYTEAVKNYGKAAYLGYAPAQNSLGQCYQNGEGIMQDFAQAVEWYRKAAEQGNILAQYNLGHCYENGIGLKQNDSEAAKWFRRAAEQGYAIAQFRIGNFCYSGRGVMQNHIEAVNWFRLAAEQGLAGAQNQLGICYYKGIGVTQDYAAAVKWLRRAAGQGLDSAQHSLGICYDYGHGVSQSSTEAVGWFRKAAIQGLAVAQSSLGDCYYHGDGVSKDYVEAVKWFRAAAEQGIVRAQYQLGSCYYSGEGVAQNYDECVKWLRRAAEQGLVTAQSSLGYMYCYGKGVKQDYSEAIKWDDMAARQGDEAAKKRLRQLIGR